VNIATPIEEVPVAPPASSWYESRMPLADEQIRARVFAWLDVQVAVYGDRIPWQLLQSFELDGKRTALVTQRGIRWLPGMPALAFTTTYSANPAKAPYADRMGLDGLPRYKYQGTDPSKADNVAMKAAAKIGVPLVWFVGTDAGVYTAIYPVFVGASDDAELDFTIFVDVEQRAIAADERMDPITKRRYVERLTRQRLHQPIFRSQVLRAYETKCAICRLKHAALLDAAHILSDSLGGQPVVPNGLAMCKIHHAAYDQDLLSITPDYRVQVKPSVLLESDGPMLLHGLQEVDGWAIELPRRTLERPDRQLLLARHSVFLRSA
jgi:putative restriction endonuclease